MSDFWSGRKVLVTGGNGFLGRVVVGLLAEKGASVVAPPHDEYDLVIPGVADTMLAAHQPTHVIHLAARVGGGPACRPAMATISTSGTDCNAEATSSAEMAVPPGTRCQHCSRV